MLHSFRSRAEFNESGQRGDRRTLSDWLLQSGEFRAGRFTLLLVVAVVVAAAVVAVVGVVVAVVAAAHAVAAAYLG